jgi:hypothetical protein
MFIWFWFLPRFFFFSCFPLAVFPTIEISPRQAFSFQVINVCKMRQDFVFFFFLLFLIRLAKRKQVKCSGEEGKRREEINILLWKVLRDTISFWLLLFAH